MVSDFSVPPLPDGKLARGALVLVGGAESAIANHSIRSFLFAALLARHRGWATGREFDAELLFVACALHDIGLTQAGNGRQRFEIEGADLASEFLAAQHVESAEIDLVWEAIALSTSQGIAERRGSLSELTSLGILMDSGYGTEFISDELADAIHLAYPRQQIAKMFVDAVVRQTRGRPEKAPAFSLPAVLTAERTTPGRLSSIETAALRSRWARYE